MSLYIVDTGHYCANIDGDMPSLKALVKETVGSSVRRIDRFIQLTLIGAGRAAEAIPTESGIYFASGRGDMEITVELLEGIYRDGLAPKPLSFVNSVSNAASFYAAQCLGLCGPSLFVTSRYFAMETALHAAAMDMVLGKVSSALAGAVDTVLSPLDDHRERLGLAADTPVAEASFWLQLCTDPGERKVLATFDSICHFMTMEALLTELLSKDFAGDTKIAFNQFMSMDDRQRCMAHFGLEVFDDSSRHGHFDCRSGEVIIRFIEQGRGNLLFISGDRYGRYQAMVFSRAVPRF